ncbi:caspase family protein [Cesiribacter andamanensis]|uniref:caspase family protein n=1 Tax=Cesiribacter andamanensis TaxID=649507 RepID=UPI001F2B0B4D|nr:caspase family protein [Cesiribacter andamanensis]
MLAALATNPAYELVVDTLMNESATAEALVRWQKNLQQAGVNDVVLVYLAGHGMLDPAGNFYFGTYDFDMAAPAEKGIHLDTLKALIAGSTARKRLMLLDACQSGNTEFYQLLGSGRPAGAAAGSVLASRGAREVGGDQSQPGLADPAELLQEVFGTIRGSGIDIIGASSASQHAYEGLGLQNGAFSYFVIRGLTTGAADTDRDGSISIAELKAYVTDAVADFTAGRQKPTSREENPYYNWRIY